ncbi:hypothetical protein FUAX_01770 [Fulvitalea axinellae]|uniref:Gliding motility lipoprotein GldD n=1 Tax=Fulvitalea axinellae TaxID=1182444 RepID=A0AAU9CEI0_9BACT|nr:hypothetical protein FUAX_01770 [Fulvitalea axinellae]
MRKTLALVLPGLLATLLWSCGQKDYYPKPLGYNRIELPPQQYTMSADSMPYRFEMSKHAVMLDDTSWISKRYWSQLYYPKLEASVELTYYNLKKDGKFLRELIEDSHRLSEKHQNKASSIESGFITTDEGYRAVITEIEGDVPTQFNFFVTDSTDNFLRGALYFRTSLKNDSLAPVIDYVKRDMVRMIKTTRWNVPK